MKTPGIQSSFINQIGSSQALPASEDHSSEDKKLAALANNTLINAPKTTMRWNKRIVKWIKSIPTALLGIFKRLFCKHKVAAAAATPVNEKLIQKKESLSPEIISRVLQSLKNEKSNLHAEVKRLKFASIEDWLTLNDLETQIYNGIEVLAELNLLLDSSEKETKTLKNILDQFNTLKNYFENKRKSNAPAIKKLKQAADYMYKSLSQEELETVKKNPQSLITLIEAAEKKCEQASLDHQKSQELIQTLLTPPKFKNEANNCWFHSALQILWTMGPDFTRMVHDRVAKRDELANREMEQEDIIEAMWGNKYNEDELDPLPLLDALRDYVKAVEAGDSKSTEAGERAVQRAAINLFPTLRTPGRQQDPNEFLIELFDFLAPAPFFDFSETASGEGDLSYLKKEEKKPASILNLLLKNQNEFQTILNNNFLPERQLESRPINGKPVPSWIKQDKIVANGPPPEFLFVQLMRAEQLPHQEILAQEKNIEDQINEFAQSLRSKDENLDEETARIIAKQMLSDEDLLPEIVAVRKNTTRVTLPNNNRIDFSKAFGLNESHPSYQYELHGTITHHGMDGSVGHYTANIRGTNPKNGKNTWFECDDCPSNDPKADPMNYQNALTSNQDAYLFYFRRVPANNESK